MNPADTILPNRVCARARKQSLLSSVRLNASSCNCPATCGFLMGGKKGNMGDLESLAQLRDIVLEERWFAKLYLGSLCDSVFQ